MIIIGPVRLDIVLKEFKEWHVECIVYIQGGQTAAREPHANTF